MRLSKLTIKNFRLFSDFQIGFHPELTVIVAPNGGGKTTILDAIRIAYGPFLSALPTGKGNGIDNSDVRQFKTSVELNRMEPALPVEIAVTGELDAHHPASWRREKISEKGSTTRKDAAVLTDLGKQLLANVAKNENWPLLAYYGTGRLWNQLKLTERKIFTSGFQSRAAGYLDCMEPASSYKFFKDWFRYVTRADGDLKLKFIEKNPSATAEQIAQFKGPFSVLVSAVKQAVNTVLEPTGWGGLSYSLSLEDASIEHPEHGVLAVSQMSDGIRNSLALAADIAWRCVQLNEHLGDRAVIATEGIVLIDEVDMHLHPEWQQLVISTLRKAFPAIQFIVTTHSPQVLTTVHRECIRILHGTDGQIVVETPAHETYAQESRTTLEDVFDVDSRPPMDINKKLQEYLKLVESGNDDTVKARKLRDELIASLGEGDPQLQLADMLIARNAARKGQAR